MYEYRVTSEETIASLQLKYTADLTRQTVTADLIINYNRTRDGDSNASNKVTENRSNGNHTKPTTGSGNLKRALKAQTNKNICSASYTRFQCFQSISPFEEFRKTLDTFSTRVARIY